MKQRTWQRRLLLAGVVLLVFSAGAIALAYWLASGTATGSATTGTAVAVTLTPATPDGTLYPGGRADVALTVSNPNAASVTLGSLALDATQGTGGFSVDAAHSGCATSVLSFTTQRGTGAGWTVPAATGGVAGTLPVTLPNALTMGAGAADSCQGAQFTVYLVAGP